MNLFKNFFFIIFFFFLSINSLKAEDKVFYVDIDFLLTDTIAGKELLYLFKKEEESKINIFKLNDENFNNEKKKILAKKNLISKEKINNELNLLNNKFQEYDKEKAKEVNEFKIKRNRNIVNFLNLITPIIEKYMKDNSIYMLIDKKNVFIANKDYDITNNLIELIDKQIKNIEIK